MRAMFRNSGGVASLSSVNLLLIIGLGLALASAHVEQEYEQKHEQDGNRRVDQD
jgi:hypothetical protein